MKMKKAWPAIKLPEFPGKAARVLLMVWVADQSDGTSGTNGAARRTHGAGERTPGPAHAICSHFFPVFCFAACPMLDAGCYPSARQPHTSDGPTMDSQGSRCKIVVVGDTQCGKTALLHVFAKDCYPEVGLNSSGFNVKTQETRSL